MWVLEEVHCFLRGRIGGHEDDWAGGGEAAGGRGERVRREVGVIHQGDVGNVGGACC